MASEYKLGLTYRLNPNLVAAFVHLEPQNEDICHFIEIHGGTFTVAAMDEKDVCEVVMADGTRSPSFFYLYAKESDYFDVVEKNSEWVPGTVYRCKDLHSFIALSPINKRWALSVGTNPFKVEAVDYDCGYSRTKKISFTDRLGTLQVLNFALVKSELKYFDVVHPGFINEHFFEDEEMTLEDEIENISEAEEWNAEVEGVMVFKIESESERKKAIEILKTMKWKK
ncbi:putative FRD2 protein [Klebsiella phage vB_KpnM_VPA32]|uniref:Uncharacterized protein n=1 Tax=Cronobacter phage Pet-CM3-4 TaxID=1892569 RepID=A0A1D3RKG6_9CAUD|nr:goF mRNA metabolism modulator [Cronobacter phage Pet-CM3-4]ULA52247.1 hypothetical protein [Enterobacter phage vB-EclM_KMB19]WJJ58980.1 putative FRD2 protein [Klebsiella phage vB_KpnM_VPA32]SCN45703.1 hypothetical protein [Cronobacter phage Pet-CM3-4]